MGSGCVATAIFPDRVWRWYYNVVGKGEAVIVDTWWQTENGGFLCSTNRFLPQGVAQLDLGRLVQPRLRYWLALDTWTATRLVDQVQFSQCTHQRFRCTGLRQRNLAKLVDVHPGSHRDCCDVHNCRCMIAYHQAT